MYNFWTAIITKYGSILKDESQSYLVIKEKFNLNDKVDDLNRLNFCSVEILPKYGKLVVDEPTKDNWGFNLSGCGGYFNGFVSPNWFRPRMEVDCWKEFQKDYENLLELISKDDWYRLLKVKPEYAEKCDKQRVFKEFNGDYWKGLLKDQPSLVNYFDRYEGFKEFNVFDWEYLRDYQPELVEKYRNEKL